MTVVYFISTILGSRGGDGVKFRLVMVATPLQSETASTLSQSFSTRVYIRLARKWSFGYGALGSKSVPGTSS